MIRDEERRNREALEKWIGEHLADLCETEESRNREFPQAVDFILIVATEDMADGESDTFYHIVSSNASHYRKVGLITVLKHTYLARDDGDD